MNRIFRKVFPLCGLLAMPALQAQTRPNIVYILADDLGYGDLGCYGQQRIETPNIDRLAQEGIRFTNFYSGSPVSGPARCSLLTGLHTGHAGIRGNDECAENGDAWDFSAAERDSTREGQRPMPTGTLTVATLLRRAGYATGIAGKWGLGNPGSESTPTKQGFDFFYGYNCQRQAHTYYPTHLWLNDHRVWLGNTLINPHRVGLDKDADPNDTASYDKFTSRVYSPDVIHAQAMQFIDQSKEQPFFLYYATPLPHVPLQAATRLENYYHKKFGDEKYFNGGANDYFPTRYPHAAYAAMVGYIDEKVGEVVKFLKDHGLYDNTIIIVSSDNGPTWNGGTDSPWFDSARPFKSEYGWGKCFLHEGGIRVPLIVSWPGHIKAGAVSNLPCASYDMLATLCELAQYKETPATDGISLAPTLLGKGEQKAHEYLYWEYLDDEGQQAVRKGKWKAIRNEVKKFNTALQLFDLSTDSVEQNDVAAAHPDIVAEMASIMKGEHQTAYWYKFRTPSLDNDQRLTPGEVHAGMTLFIKTLSSANHERFFNGMNAGVAMSDAAQFKLEDAHKIVNGTAAYYLQRQSDGLYVQKGRDSDEVRMGSSLNAAPFEIVSCKGITTATFNDRKASPSGLDKNSVMFTYTENKKRYFLNCQGVGEPCRLTTSKGNGSTWNIFNANANHEERFQFINITPN